MELIIQALKNEESWTSSKTNPRSSIHLNKLVLKKVNKAIDKIEEQHGIKLTQCQYMYCASLALDALGNSKQLPNFAIMDEQLRVAKLMNNKMATQIGMLHKQIIDLKKNNALRTSK